MKKESRFMKSKSENLKPKNSFIIEKLEFGIFAKWFFFWFLVILLIILIYGNLLPDFGFGFLVPFWKKLDLVLGITVFFGILAVFTRRS